MKNAENMFLIYDNGGETIDRYTAVLKSAKRCKINGFYDMIAFSDNPKREFYQHCMGEKGSHLGKRIPFSKLNETCQQYLRNELE